MNDNSTNLGVELERRRLFGFDFVVNHDRAHEAVVDAMVNYRDPGAGPLPMVVTPNVDILVRLAKPEHRIEREMTEDAAFVVADGAPVVAAARRLGIDIGVRTPGSDLFPLIWQGVIDAALPVVVVAPSTEVATGLAAEYPSARVVTAPMLDIDNPEQMAGFARRVAAEAMEGRHATHIFLSLGNPKQMMLSRLVLESWPQNTPRPLFLCFGAAAEMHLGLQARAPEIMQDLGLEWLHRFGREPRRLFRRYFVDDVAFIGIAANEWREQRR